MFRRSILWSLLRPFAAATMAVAIGLAALLPARSGGQTGEPANYRPPADPAALLTVDDEMRQFFANRVDRRVSPEAQLEQLLDAILDAKGLAFAYSVDGNFDARETFRRRGGNCVSFSLLVVAVARDFGLEARFNEVGVYPQWDQVGGFVAEIRHLNVLVTAGSATFEIDLLPRVDRRLYPGAVTPVSDARAFAQFYCNVGVSQLVSGDHPGGLWSLRQATTIDPTCAVAWLDLGNAYAGLGEMASAQRCLERALKENPVELAAINSLAQLYARMGQREKAAQFEKRAQRYRAKNPYYHFALARDALAKAQWPEAEHHLAKAISLKRDDPEFYRVRIEVAQRLGRTGEAQRWMAKLQELEAGRPARKPAS